MQTLERAAPRLTDLFPPAGGVRLSAEALAAFERDGWCGPIDVLDAAQLGAVRAAVDRIVAAIDAFEPSLYEVEHAFTERPDEVVCHFLGGWLVDPVLHDLIRHPAATVPVAQVLGVERLRFWHDQVFAKPPRHPGVVPFHQDYSYWTRTAPPRHATINIALDDSDLDNGCLHFVPGSHRGGLLPRVPFDGAADAVREHLAGGALPTPVAAPLRAGQATIHDSHTLHGSYENRSDRPRRNVVLNFMAPDTRVADDSAPLLRGVPTIARGELVAGDYFPIVLDVSDPER